ncbi:MAG: hypothetical protein WAO74_12450 [Polaribacter sp.]|uniref:hypothetical protein n=1 Tax=Polaribacter sp. TaxID=1920175 RepID=UPI003BB0AEFE
MKKYLSLLILLVFKTIYAQDYKAKIGFVAESYNLVSYFDHRVTEGKSEFIMEFDGLKLKFASKENPEILKKEADKNWQKFISNEC